MNNDTMKLATLDGLEKAIRNAMKRKSHKPRIMHLPDTACLEWGDNDRMSIKVNTETAEAWVCTVKSVFIPLEDPELVRKVVALVEKTRLEQS